MKRCKIMLLAMVSLIAYNSKAQVRSGTDARMNQFITNLMSKMTLDEKLGQLNLPGAGDITGFQF